METGITVISAQVMRKSFLQVSVQYVRRTCDLSTALSVSEEVDWS